MTEHEKHIEVRNLLKKLRSVNASSDFVPRLQQRIQEEEMSEKHHRSRRHNKLFDLFRSFGNGKNHPWLMPAAGFAALMFFALFYVYSSRMGEDKAVTEDSKSSEQSVKEMTPETAMKDSDSLINSVPGSGTIADNLDKKLPGAIQPSETSLITGNENTSDRELKSAPDPDKPQYQSGVNISEAKADYQAGTESTELQKPDIKRQEESANGTETMSAESPPAMLSQRPEYVIRADTVRKAAFSKLDILNRKWLEEIGKKISEER